MINILPWMKINSKLVEGVLILLPHIEIKSTVGPVQNITPELWFKSNSKKISSEIGEFWKFVRFL